MFSLLAQSESYSLLQRIDPDFLGVIGLVSVVLGFVFITVSTITICRTLQNISLAKMQNSMINELLAKGYTVDEIQQLVSGKRRSVLTRFFDDRCQSYVSQRPTAPIKHPA